MGIEAPSTNVQVRSQEDYTFREAVRCIVLNDKPFLETSVAAYPILKIQALRIIIYYIGNAYLKAQHQFVSLFVTRTSLQITKTFVDGTVVNLLDRTNQFNYENSSIGCAKKDARGACASFTLAALTQNSSFPSINKILKLGFITHQSYGLKNAEGVIDVTTYAYPDEVIEHNAGVASGGMPVYAFEKDQTARYRALLNSIAPNSGGLLQVGVYFLMCKKNEDDSIEVFDSHGSCHGFNHNHGAYHAKLPNADLAATFLSLHRNIHSQNGSSTQVVFHPLDITSEQQV